MSQGTNRTVTLASLAKTIRSKNAGVDKITFDIIFSRREDYELVQRSGVLSRAAICALYGIPDSAYHGDAEMFKLMHEMRVRIITAPAFTGDKVIGAILFEATMDGQAKDKPVPTFLWEKRGVVPFLKVDKGLEAERDGVSVMKPIPGLDALLARAVTLGVFGTKMRSVINLASQDGIAAVVAQQFEVEGAAGPDHAHAGDPAEVGHRAAGGDHGL